ncbi:PIN domain nuclease [bacterium]
MILVDTSVLIDFLKDIKNSDTKKMNEIMELEIPFGITSHIYQEVLQGASNIRHFELLKSYFNTFNFYLPKDIKASYEEAAKIYFQCRKKGITIRSTIDCLIVQICVENELKLLHKDKDFEKISKVVKKLKFY